MKILVLGATGMLGSAVFHVFNHDDSVEVLGTTRGKKGLIQFPASMHSNLISDVDVLDMDRLCSVFAKVRPDVVINCIGLIKQLECAGDPLIALPINAMFPHRLAKLCALSNARLIHISTDCVFSGKKGFYEETDESDAVDLYGKSKFIGEVKDLRHVVTIRSSIIGHEMGSKNALVEWFLAQENEVNGYTKAIFSGLPTMEMAGVIRDHIIMRPDLFGLYHVAAEPINKFELLALIAEIYNKKINIVPEGKIVIDRSLKAERFKSATGYIAPAWPELVTLMHESKKFYEVN